MVRNDINAILTFNSVICEIINLYKKTDELQLISICDIGCSDGQLLSLLSNNGFKNLTGVGYEISVLENISDVNGINLSQENWSNNLRGSQFDCVISTDVIEHQTNVYVFLIEIRKIIKKQGYLILTFPNIHNIKSIILYAINGRFTGFFGRNFNAGHPLFDQHIFIPNIHLINYLLQVTGFSVKKIKYINGIGKFLSQTTMLIAVPIE